MNDIIKCFLIDDDDDDQEIFKLALQDLDSNIQFECSISCQKALMKLNADKKYIPHFIFIDLNMPLLNGKECLAEIKKIRRLQEVPVFMYSTSADPKLIEEIKVLGAVDFIVKPVDISELTDTLRTVLNTQNIAAI